jgi:predicted deacylase
MENDDMNDITPNLIEIRRLLEDAPPILDPTVTVPTSKELCEKVTTEARRLGFKRNPLSEGRNYFTSDRPGPRVFITSGIHGDEPAGPMAVLKLFQRLTPDMLPHLPAMWILPLLSFEAFDGETREAGGRDLNRAWNDKKVPSYMAEVRDYLKAHVPDVFLDLHEDPKKDVVEPYTFRSSTEPGIIADMQDAFGMTPKKPDYEGSITAFVDGLGCRQAATIETPEVWPLQERITFHTRILIWVLRNTLTYL